MESINKINIIPLIYVLGMGFVRGDWNSYSWYKYIIWIIPLIFVLGYTILLIIKRNKLDKINKWKLIALIALSIMIWLFDLYEYYY